MSPSVGAQTLREIAASVRKRGLLDDGVSYGVTEDEIATISTMLIQVYDAKTADDVQAVVNRVSEGTPDTPEGFATFCDRVADECDKQAKAL